MQSEARAILLDRGWRWVSPENFHITILFLGDVLETQVETLRENIQRHLQQQDPAEYEFSAPSGFDGRNPGNVLALMARPPLTFFPLRQVAESAARASGIAADFRELRPHVTLARRREFRRIEPQILHALEGIRAPTERFKLESLGLFQSIQSQVGVRYRSLTSWAIVT